MRLTKQQCEDGIGAELLSLCTRISEDGAISGDEVEQLLRWLRSNQNAGLPAIAHLTTTMSP